MFIIVCQCVWIFQENDVSRFMYLQQIIFIGFATSITFLKFPVMYLVDHMSFVIQLSLGTFGEA